MDQPPHLELKEEPVSVPYPGVPVTGLNFPPEMPPTKIDERNDFVKKLYGILAVQLLLTFSIVYSGIHAILQI